MPFNLSVRLQKKCAIQIDKNKISNYLTFFETIYLLHLSGVVNIKTLNELFSYRFFLATHSKLFQQEKLQVQPFNFRNIYKLEKEWLKYRKIHNTDAETSVYHRNKLETCVSKEDYDLITQN